jgi:hypothetical protein
MEVDPKSFHFAPSTQAPIWIGGCGGLWQPFLHRVGAE